MDHSKLSKWYALPFLCVLALLTVISLIIPLRPTVSYGELRDLETFPAFSVDALLSGDYFDGITLWFSDTFPGREGWIDVSQSMATLYGHSEIAFSGTLSDTPVQPSLQETPLPDPSGDAPVSLPEETAASEETQPTSSAESVPGETQTAETEFVPPEIELEDIFIGQAIQIGDTGYNQLKISPIMSDKYAKTLSGFADRMAEKGVRVISAPAPTSIGVMVDPAYLQQLNCSPQDEMLDYMHNQMSDNVIKVDTVRKLMAHKDEYIFYRTDHHWSALGAYYAYQAVCEAAGMEAVALEDMTYWNQGEMIGSIYGKVPYPRKLKRDELECWVPQGNITMYRSDREFGEFPMIRDVSNQKPEGKYCAFLAADAPIVHIVNEDLPDGPNCLIFKDSFGNCFTPYFSQNYHNVYAIDYRKYWDTSMASFVEKYDIDDVIIAPYMIATQDTNAGSWFQNHFR